MAVQVNGKVRARISVSADASEETVKELALSSVSDQTAGAVIKKVVVVPRKLVSIVMAGG
ncbi:MAG: hypothetical protein M1565_04435 [Actinobacteria bacterium]|nr:hypothetical protein [Actinomycetota bacterium]